MRRGGRGMSPPLRRRARSRGRAVGPVSSAPVARRVPPGELLGESEAIADSEEAVVDEPFEPVLVSVSEEDSGSDAEDTYEAPRPMMVAFVGLSGDAVFTLSANVPCFVAGLAPAPAAEEAPLRRSATEPGMGRCRGRTPPSLSSASVDDATEMESTIPMVPRANSWPGHSKAGFLPRISMHLCSQKGDFVEQPPLPPGGSSQSPKLFKERVRPTSSAALEQKKVGKKAVGKPDLFGLVCNLLEGALSGVATESFGDIDPNYATALGLPSAASLQPCSRPSFTRHVCITEVPGAEPFPVDCLPSSSFVAPASSPAPPTPLRELAQRMAAIAVVEGGTEVPSSGVRPPPRPRDERLRTRPNSGGRVLTMATPPVGEAAGELSPTRPPRLHLPANVLAKSAAGQPMNAPRPPTTEARRSPSSSSQRDRLQRCPSSSSSRGGRSENAGQKETRSLFGASTIAAESALAMDLGEDAASRAASVHGSFLNNAAEAGMASFVKTPKSGTTVSFVKGAPSLPPIDPYDGVSGGEKARRLLPAIMPTAGTARVRGSSWRVDLVRGSRAPGIF